MADYNKVILLGRLTRDPELQYTGSNTAVCQFSLAVGRKYKTAGGEQREETSFVDCTLWGKAGEVFNQHMGKGRQVLVDGRLKQETWDDKTTGQKRSKLGVVVENFTFIGGKTEGGQQHNARNDSPRVPQPQFHGDPGFVEASDIPF